MIVAVFCLSLLTKGEKGVKNDPKNGYVIFERPLTMCEDITIVSKNLVVGKRGKSCDSNQYAKARIVPNIIPDVPDYDLKVVYGGNYTVGCGEDVERIWTEYQPVVNFPPSFTKFYTLVMIDPDAPDPHKPVFSHFLHWLVVNIPESRLEDGKSLTNYMRPSPPPYSIAHRYIILIYEQPTYIRNADYMVGKGRSRFSLTDMVEKLQLKGPTAGNFFYVRHENARKEL